MYVWGIKLQMSFSRCSFVDFVTSSATDQPIFAGRPVNRTKISQGESQNCHWKRTRSYMRAKSGCVNDGYPGFIRRVHRSFLTTYADRALFCAYEIFLCVRTSYTMICKAPFSQAKKRISTLGLPTFWLKVINLSFI